jgi:hypothetical protein
MRTMRTMLSVVAVLLLAGCATTGRTAAAPEHTTTILVENQTIENIVVRVDGVRVGTVRSSETACIVVHHVHPPFKLEYRTLATQHGASVVIPLSGGGAWYWRVSGIGSDRDTYVPTTVRCK